MECNNLEKLVLTYFLVVLGRQTLNNDEFKEKRKTKYVEKPGLIISG